MTEKDIDRRPIAARSLKFSVAATDRLVAWGFSPNGISLWSIVFGCASGLCFWATSLSTGYNRLLFVFAAFFILLRLLANMFDGMVAVKTGTTSAIGELFNEIPDRISDSAILIGAGYGIGGWSTAGFLAALTAMLTAYVRAVGKGAGARQEFCGPLAKQQRMFLMILCSLYLALTPVTWHPHWSEENQCGLIAAVLSFIAIGSLYTSWRRLTRISSMLVTNHQNQGIK